ncbi:hypothetical protein V6Z77_010222 [Aspergillus fumigatus]
MGPAALEGDRWAGRAQASRSRPARRGSEQVPLRPKQQANLRGPLCMGAQANARTTHQGLGPRHPDPDPGTFAPRYGPVEVGGSCGGESRVTSGGVRALRRPLLPCQAGGLSVTGGAQVPSVGPRFRNGAVAHPSRGFSLERPARSVLVRSSRLRR